MTRNTTVYMRNDIYDRLALAAEQTGVKRNAIISALLTYMADDWQRDWSGVTAVRYQEKREEGEWRRFHLGIGQTEYNFFVDFRVVVKFSVSYLVCMAIEQYLDYFVQNLIGQTDNYRRRFHATYTANFKHCTCIVLCWGIPPKLFTGTEPPEDKTPPPSGRRAPAPRF